MKKTDAQTHIEVNCSCPYCERFQDIWDKGTVAELMGFDMVAYNVDIEITCENCDKPFIVTDIFY